MLILTSINNNLGLATRLLQCILTPFIACAQHFVADQTDARATLPSTDQQENDLGIIFVSRLRLHSNTCLRPFDTRLRIAYSPSFFESMWSILKASKKIHFLNVTT